MSTFPDDFNLADYFLFDREREGQGPRTAIRFGDRAWTYAEVAERSRALARFFVASGVRAEQRVYVVLPDIPPFAWSIRYRASARLRSATSVYVQASAPKRIAVFAPLPSRSRSNRK